MSREVQSSFVDDEVTQISFNPSYLALQKNPEGSRVCQVVPTRKMASKRAERFSQVGCAKCNKVIGLTPFHEVDGRLIHVPCTRSL